MGKIAQGIFGGSRSKSKSDSKYWNQNNDAVTGALNPAMGYVTDSGNLIKAFLSGDKSGFENYKKSTGYDWTLQQGQDGVTGNAAAQGLLNSGGTSKALVQYGNDLQQTYADKYMKNLLGLGDLGNNAASNVVGAGQMSTSHSNSKSTEKPGISKFLGSAIGAAMASDRRLKTDIREIGELPNGLKVYSYRYKSGGHRMVGVMADEVARIQPEALGPEAGGYMTVDYSKIDGWENA